jgi:hypothetical protein
MKRIIFATFILLNCQITFSQQDPVHSEIGQRDRNGKVRYYNCRSNLTNAFLPCSFCGMSSYEGNNLSCAPQPSSSKVLLKPIKMLPKEIYNFNP